jgi:hypothetical protein
LSETEGLKGSKVLRSFSVAGFTLGPGQAAEAKGVRKNIVMRRRLRRRRILQLC